MDFNPSAVGQKNGQLFGMPFSIEEAQLVVIPVPWDVTVSYGDGTADAPEAILEESPQLDFFDEDFPDVWRKGIAMDAIPKKLRKDGHNLRKLAKKFIRWQENGMPEEDEDEMEHFRDLLNQACEQVLYHVKRKATTYLEHGKTVAVLGGDHSSPLGLIQALGDLHDDFGILQIDAHMDLRKAYEDLYYSHASIMYNALKVNAVSKLVQVGIRDCCDEEMELVRESKGRVEVFSSRQMARDAAAGKTWQAQCDEIVQALPQKVYFSFDIDGLEPQYCPGTGTPVPGGLGYEQTLYLLRAVKRSGRKIIGFDLCEVGTSAWDANVGARVLWQMCLLVLAE